MARRVFYSFHYQPDCHRAAIVRNMGVVEGNRPATDNDWEAVKRGGNQAIQHWIDTQLNGKSCTAILIGENTAGRKWINYEIEASWNNCKGLFGVYIHTLKDLGGNQVPKGKNPFEEFVMGCDKNKRLSSLVKAYDPPYSASSDSYAYIKDNFTRWIEDAISIRENWG